MENFWQNDNLVRVLKEGGVVVMPTDTIYGVVGRAENKDVVEKIYKIRKRAPEKPCIILISNITDLEKFSISLSGEQKKEVDKFWPSDGFEVKFRPTSIIFDCLDESLAYLHRDTYSLAFRLPHASGLRNLIKETGPLLAPSANTEGNIPAQNVPEAKNYFGSEVDLYIDGGEIISSPSMLIKLHKDGSLDILRS
jgi:L-threonylcarbamoyladenylate synthase